MACTVVGLALLVGRAREVAFGVDTVAPSEAAQKRSSLIHALTPVILTLLGAMSTMGGGGSLAAIASAFVVFHMLGPTPVGTLQAALKADRLLAVTKSHKVIILALEHLAFCAAFDTGELAERPLLWVLSAGARSAEEGVRRLNMGATGVRRVAVAYELAWAATVLLTTTFAAPARGTMPTFERPALALLLASRLVALPWWVGKKAWGGYWVVLTKQVEVAVLTALGGYWVQGHVPEVEDMISKEFEQHVTGYSIIFVAYTGVTFTFLAFWYVLFIMEEEQDDEKDE